MEITLHITDLARSGAGVARDAQGRVVFVPFTAPGDHVRAEIVSEDKRYAEARILEILSPSPERAAPPCPVFGKCGGCEWQHLPYERQWQAKKNGVLHALKRVEVDTQNIAWDDLPAERMWEYRNRVQLRGFRDSIGFYARGSNQLVPIEKCYIARPELNAKIQKVKQEGTNRPREYKVELEVFPDGQVTESWNAGHSAQGFRQVHDEQNAKLQNWVAKHLENQKGVLLDLYGGRGNLSLHLTDQFSEIHCVDIGAPASPPPGTRIHYHFHRAPVLDSLRQKGAHLSSLGKPIQVVLDPPREGLGSDLAPIVEILKSLPVQKTLLIGCEPDPWARALHRLQKHGWAVDRIGALDFFPQTHHVEALASLSRPS